MGTSTRQRQCSVLVSCHACIPRRVTKGIVFMIQVEGLTKRYGQRLAVDNVTFNAERGEIVGFLGPNGAGKTTTMRILTGYMPASEGKAVVAGYDVFTHSLEARKRTGYLPESVPLYTDMTVWQYLDF